MTAHAHEMDNHHHHDSHCYLFLGPITEKEVKKRSFTGLYSGDVLLSGLTIVCTQDLCLG